MTNSIFRYLNIQTSMGTLRGHCWIILVSDDDEYIRCTMDLCVAYDDVPSHVSWRLMCLHSFVRSSHKAEAGEAPLGTQWSNGEYNASFSVSSCCLGHSTRNVGLKQLYRAWECPSSFAHASNAMCFVQIACNTFNSFPHRTTMDCFLRNGFTCLVV